MVIGGAGHIGAPLAIVLAHAGWRTIACDVDRTSLARLAAGNLPFMEQDAEEVLRQVIERGTLEFSPEASVVRGARFVVVTIGTPIDEFHNPQIEIIRNCIDGLVPHLENDQTLILCSTVPPGTTAFVHRHLQAKGLETRVAFCPERVVQGKAVVEMRLVPQIVSGATPAAEEAAATLFGRFAPSVVRMRPQEAEFAKLITNAYRYIQFAAANQFYMMMERNAVDWRTVLEGVRRDYPRMRDFPGPGFAAGPCLMKDTMQLASFGSEFPLGNAAMRINEGLPDFIVERISRHRTLTGARVGILGMAFKADIDDTRDSLSYKLLKILRFRGAEVLCSDECAKDPNFVSKERLIESSDIIVVGVPHSAYRTLRVPEGKHVVDLWGALPR